MKSISALIDSAVKKFTDEDMPKLRKNLSSNLEFRLLFHIDLTKPFKEAKKDFLKNYFNDLLTLSLGNISLAAKKAQVHRRHLHRIINQLKIDPEEHKRELLKPKQYMKEYVSDIVEETLDDFEQTDKIKNIYSNLDDISQVIAEHIKNMSYEEALELFEKEYIEKALKENNYNVQKTAESISINERTLYRKINKLGIA